MNSRKPLRLVDSLFLASCALFFLGCIATSHWSGKTLQPGQASVSGSYLEARNAEEFDNDPVRLIALDGRVGAARGLDFGVLHTWDVSTDNENAFATFWGDFKVQTTNRDNKIGGPIFSLGLMKGYIYDPEIHVTTLPLTLSLPASHVLTPFFTFRYELLSDGFIPDDFNDPRTSFILGTEINLTRETPGKWTPVLGLSLGTFNSLDGSDDGDRGVTFNVGIGVKTPGK